jgi:transcriptional regulator with AAA-type ATPase domain
MSWLTIAWSMCAAISAMLGIIQLSMWLRNRNSLTYPLAMVMAFSASAMTISELALIYSQSIPHYANLLKIENLMVYILLISMVWLAYLYMGTARRSLALLITATWSVAIVMNFASPYSLVFSDISSLQSLLTYWGEGYTVAIGTTNPWKLLADLSSILILVYIFDASVRLWKQGKRERALLTGGSIILFMLTAGIHAPLVDAGVVRTPYMISFAFLAIVASMTYDLVRDAARAQELARQLTIAENRYLREEILNIQGAGELAGNSQAIQRIRKRIAELAYGSGPVLIRGEAGSGQLTVARALHEASPRTARPFIHVNCAAIHPDDQEEELFGKDLATFMGKKQHRRGRFELATGGTLYLEHLDAISSDVLSRLESEIHEDIRVIVSAEPIPGSLNHGFLGSPGLTTIDLPPVRDRREDIAEIVQHCVSEASKKLARLVDHVPPAVMQQLQDYDWPGNFIEMNNLIERSILTSPGSELTLPAPLANGHDRHPVVTGSKKYRLEEVERQHILAVLKQTDWRITGEQGAADLLGLNPSTLRFRMKKLGIVRPEKKNTR